MNIQAACHTAQDIHKCTQPIETRTACNTTKHTWTRVRGAKRTRDRALTQWQKMERECPNPVTWPKLKTWVPGSKHHAPTWNNTRRRESARLEHTRSRALTWKRGHDGSIRALSKTMNNTRPKWQNPDSSKRPCNAKLLFFNHLWTNRLNTPWGTKPEEQTLRGETLFKQKKCFAQKNPH